MAAEETIIDLTLAGGVDVSPDYEGSDDDEVSLVPFAEISAYDGLVSLSVEGFQGVLPLGDNVAVGAGLGYDRGRDEDDNDALEGLGDVDGASAGSLAGLASLGDVLISLTFTQALDGGHDGYTLDLGASREMEVIEDRLDVEVSAGATWASDNDMEAFFGIDAGQAAASGLDETDVDAGFKSADIDIGGTVHLTETVAFGLDLAYRRLLGDAEDSPIVRDEGSPHQFSALAYLAVEFGHY